MWLLKDLASVSTDYKIFPVVYPSIINRIDGNLRYKIETIIDKI